PPAPSPASPAPFPTRRSSDLPFLPRAGGGVVGTQNAVLDKAGLAVRQADGPPAILRLPGGGYYRAPGQGDQGIPLDLGGGEHVRSEEHTSELQSRFDLVCRLL